MTDEKTDGEESESEEIRRGKKLTPEELEEALETINSLPVEPDNDVNVRPWLRHCWW